MADIVDKATRSKMMSGIRAKNTRPEMYIRRGLHALGFRFRLHAKDIPGKPDIMLAKYRALIIVQGCFWHGHGCRYCKMPKSNTAFWQDKIRGNTIRDERMLWLQRNAGWRCLVIWECAIRSSAKTAPSRNIAEIISEWLHGTSPYATVELASDDTISVSNQPTLKVVKES